MVIITRLTAPSRQHGSRAGITKLAQQGVDETEDRPDLASGNVSAAMQWMAMYHKTHPGQTSSLTALHTGNSTGWQKGGMFQPHAMGSPETRLHFIPDLHGR